jgi:hypothetical protein
MSRGKETGVSTRALEDNIKMDLEDVGGRI